MKNTIKSLIITWALFAVAISGYSQDKQVDLYNAGEFGIGLGTGYNVEGGFKDDYTFNLTGQAVYFPFKYVGLSAELPFYLENGVSLREVGVGVVGRYPIYKGLALQTTAGSYYAWESKDFNYYIEPAVTYRFNPKWQVSLGGQYRITDFNQSAISDGNWQLRTFVTLFF